MWGNDATKESSQAIKRTKIINGVIEHIEKQFQNNFPPGKNIAIDYSTVGLSAK
jgi:hypothetical protein